MRVLGIVPLVGALVFALVGGDTAHATYNPPPDDGPATWIAGGSMLAYSGAGARAGLWILDPANGTERRISAADGLGERLVSPNGEWLAGIAPLAPGANAPVGLVAERIDGSERQVLSTIDPRSLNGGFAWSPDSTRLAFIAGGSVYVVRADGTGLVDVADNAPKAPEPTVSWAPDGRELSVTLNVSGQRDLAVVAADGSGLRVVAQSVRNGVWSPDGRSIASFGFVNGQFQIEIVDIASGAIRSYALEYSLSRTEIPEVLSWSADSSALIYSEHDWPQHPPPPVYRLDVVTGAQTVVVNGYDASYSPDGSQIVFLVSRDDCPDLGAGNYVMPAAGGPARRVTNICLPLTLSLDHALVTYGAEIQLDGTAPVSDIAIRINDGVERTSPAHWYWYPIEGYLHWWYRFVPCRNGDLTVTADGATAAATFAVRPRLTLKRLSATRFRFTTVVCERLDERAVLQIERDGVWRPARVLTIGPTRKRGASLVSQQRFSFHARRQTHLRIVTPASAQYAAGTSNTVTT